MNHIVKNPSYKMIHDHEVRKASPLLLTTSPQQLNPHLVTKSRSNNQESENPTYNENSMIFNMAATSKKALLLLGVATAMFATPVTGIEVRHDILTTPYDACSAQSAALCYARSLAFD
jgi:hypothetical protein